MEEYYVKNLGAIPIKLPEEELDFVEESQESHSRDEESTLRRTSEKREESSEASEKDDQQDLMIMIFRQRYEAI